MAGGSCDPWIFDIRMLWQTVSNTADKSTVKPRVRSGGFLWLNPIDMSVVNRIRASPCSQPKVTRSISGYILSVYAHCVQVANRVSKRNNVLKALSGTNWLQQNETLLLTYTPVWSTNASDTSLFVNTEIDNMTDNRVLNNRPPPINDVET